MLTRLLLAATPSPVPSPTVADIDPDRVSPGMLGLVFFLLLAVALFFLWRSMNHQLKKVDFSEPPAGTAAGTAADGAPVPPPTDAHQARDPRSSGGAPG